MQHPIGYARQMPHPLEALPAVLLVDLDDTIVSDSWRSRENWRVACEAVAAQASPPLPVEAVLAELEVERQWFWSDPERHRVGRSDLVAARRAIVSAALARLGVADTAIVEAIVAAYGARAEAARALLPGAVEALSEIRALGVRLVLVTNGAADVQAAKIERFGLSGLFEAEVIEGVLGIGKPEPAVYRHALAAVGAEPRQAWMIGDSLEWDVAAPQRLGLRGIWVDVAGHGLPADAPCRPDAIVSGLPELAALMRRLAETEADRPAAG
jgi:putative hydrolase of the HAD superfamily